ncbi:MAG: hypothetical protein FWC46_03575 [Actinomycetia bacterium]|nr:hypothetical protein [Actinomycetes bacterium]
MGRLPNGNFMVMVPVYGPDDLVGHAGREVGPDDPGYADELTCFSDRLTSSMRLSDELGIPLQDLMAHESLAGLDLDAIAAGLDLAAIAA